MSFNKYYLYRHIRLDKNEPFYIGIGTKEERYKSFEQIYKRAFSKKKRNKIWNSIASRTKYLVEIIFETDNITEIENKEIEFIELYGRIINKSGTLCNIEIGGRYNKNKVVSKETREKISAANSGKIRTIEQKIAQSIKMKGRKLSDEHRLKVSKALKGKVLSEDRKKQMSESRKGKLVPEERKEKIRKSLIGRKISQETKNKMSNSRKKWYDTHRV